MAGVTRLPGMPQPPERADRIQLRAHVQESVIRFTAMRRATLLPGLREAHPEWSEERLALELDRLQPEYEEYDPVVQLAVMAVDHENSPELRRQAASEAAQYLRPKLKSVEMVVEEVDSVAREERRQLSERLVSLLDAGLAAKRGMVVDVEPRVRESDPAPVVEDQ